MMKQTMFAKYIPNILWKPNDEQSVACDHEVLAKLILQQWERVTRSQLEKTRYIKRKIALLIEQEYGVYHLFTENYLSNLERTLPLAA